MHAVFAASLLLASTSAAVAAPNSPAACSAPARPLFADGVKTVRVVRVFRGADGESHFEDTTLTGVEHPFFDSGKSVEQTILAEGARSSLISGPANMTLPMHGSPKALFLELSGSSVVTVASGEERTLTPGMMVIFDDEGSKSGHGGRTGPCGYAALSIGWPASIAGSSRQ